MTRENLRTSLCSGASHTQNFSTDLVFLRPQQLRGCLFPHWRRRRFSPLSVHSLSRHLPIGSCPAHASIRWIRVGAALARAGLPSRRAACRETTDRIKSKKPTTAQQQLHAQVAHSPSRPHSKAQSPTQKHSPGAEHFPKEESVCIHWIHAKLILHELLI